MLVVTDFGVSFPNSHIMVKLSTAKSLLHCALACSSLGDASPKDWIYSAQHLKLTSGWNSVNLSCGGGSVKKIKKMFFLFLLGFYRSKLHPSMTGNDVIYR